MAKEYKNILVHNMVNLGDVVFSLACLPILRAAYPNAKITMLVRPKISEALQNHPCIDEVMEYDYRGKSDRLSVLKLARRLREKEFDLSISLDRKPRMAIATWIARIPERVIPNKILSDNSIWCIRLGTIVVNLPYSLFSKEQYQICQDFIARFTDREDLNGKFVPYLAAAPEANVNRAQVLLAELGAGPYIALCVRAEFHLKNWNPKYWSELINDISSKYKARLFITGTSKDKEYAQTIIDLSGLPVGNFCGRTEMLDLVALYEQSKMFITLDLGAAHVAAARGVPTVAIFCASLPTRTKPVVEISEVAWIEGLECRPCGARDCVHKKCVNELTAQLVMKKVDSVWQKI